MERSEELLRLIDTYANCNDIRYMAERLNGQLETPFTNMVLEVMPEVITIVRSVIAEKEQELMNGTRKHRAWEKTSDMTFAEQVEETLSSRSDNRNALKVCDTPAVLLMLGLDAHPVLYTKTHLFNAISRKHSCHRHHIRKNTIKQIPSELKDPVLVYDAISRDDSVVVVTSLQNEENMPIIVTLKTNGSGMYDLQETLSNFVTSIHGREPDNLVAQIEEAVRQDKLLYWNKEKSQELFSVLGLELPSGLNSLDSNTIIGKTKTNVKDIENEFSVSLPDMCDFLARYRSTGHLVEWDAREDAFVPAEGVTSKHIVSAYERQLELSKRRPHNHYRKGDFYDRA